MTLRARRTLFYSLVLVFILTAGSAVLYAQGWRLDLTTLAVSKVGAIYVFTAPADAAIRLNDRPIHRGFSIFQTGVLINDLFPKTYRVTIAKDGYLPWERRLTVRPSMVATAKHVVLIPRESSVADPGPVSAFHALGSELVRVSPTSTILWRNRTLPGDKIVGSPADGNRLLTLKTKTGEYFWNDLATATTTALAPFIRKAGATILKDKTYEILVDDTNSGRLVLRAPRLVARIDLGAGKLIPLGTTTSTDRTIGPLALARNEAAWITLHNAEGASELTVFDYDRNAAQGNGATLFAGRTAKLSWLPTGELAVLQSDGALYLYDPTRKESFVRANDVKDMTISPDGKFLAALENKSLEIFALTGTEYWRFDLPEMSAVRSIDWYRDENHLLVHYPNRVALLDFEDTSLETLQTAAATTFAAYDIDTNTLTYLNGERIMRLTFPE